MNRLLCGLAITLLSISNFSGCGSANDPYRVLGSAASLQTLQLPLPSNAQTAYGNFTPFSQSSLTMQFTFSSFGTTALTLPAPASGVVSDTSNNSVTIFHNSRMSSVVTGLSVIGVRVGDYVSQGSSIGTAGTTGLTGSIGIGVYLDGTAVCPFSFLTSAAQQTINQTTVGFGTNKVPCI